MLDLVNMKKRYYDVRITEKIVLKLEAPSKKILDELMSLSSVEDAKATDEIYEVAERILNKNKTNFKVNPEIVRGLDTEQLGKLLTGYLNWVASVRKSPN